MSKQKIIIDKINILVDNYINKLQEIGFDKYPTGWTKKSVKKYAKNIGGDVDLNSREWFYKCVDKLKDEEGIDNPEELCATIKDEALGNTKWRGKERKKN